MIIFYLIYIYIICFQKTCWTIKFLSYIILYPEYFPLEITNKSKLSWTIILHFAIIAYWIITICQTSFTININLSVSKSLPNLVHKLETINSNWVDWLIYFQISATKWNLIRSINTNLFWRAILMVWVEFTTIRDVYIIL